MGEAALAEEAQPILELIVSEREDPSGVVQTLKRPEPKQSYIREIIPRFSIEELPDRYILRNIYHNGMLSDVEWGKGLLENGKEHNHKGWSEKEHEQDLKPVDSRVLTSVVSALCENRDAYGEQGELIEELRAEIAGQLKPENGNHTYMNVKIYPKQSIYSSKDSNKVTFSLHEGISTFDSHAVENKDNYGMGRATKQRYEEHLRVLLGKEDSEEVTNAYRWLTGNNDLKIKMEGSLANSSGIFQYVSLGIDNDSLCINTERFSSDHMPAIGARLKYK